MRSFLSLALLVAIFRLSYGQVSINTSANPPDPSSMLDISGTGKGLLIPRMTFAQRNSIDSPANALLIYQTDSSPGFYFNRGTPVTPEWIFLQGLPGENHLEDRIPIDSLPYTISNTGSYYVTDNLNGPVGITISTSNVTLDLNGYSLVGTVGNNSEGIEVSTASTNIVIRNGGISHWGREGIKATLATHSSFDNLQILNNSLDGIAAGNNNQGSFLLAGNNTFDGIDFGESAVLLHCTAGNNLNDGIEADAGSSLLQCTARDNAQNGIRTTGSSTITNCSATENNNHGFSCGSGSTLSQNVASNNSQSGFYLFSSSLAIGNTSKTNGNHGFEWLNDCVLESNTASLNAYSGFSTTYTGGKVDGNTSTGNANHGYNIQNTGGCQVTRNTASGNGISPYNVLAGNTFASVITSATINTNTNPFANFQL
jgi:hypothetical protein